MSEVAENWRRVRAEVDAAALRSGRDPSKVGVIAVSKKQPLPVIEDALQAGLNRFGENYAQELADKAASLPSSVEWHFIGKLQRNKVKQVVGVARLIHAVDSQSLIAEIDKRAAAAGLTQDILLAVNVGGEAQKSGVDAGDLRRMLERCGECANLRCMGLMTMPPWPENAEDSRPHFRQLRELRDSLVGDGFHVPHLSMGTSGDFTVAVEEGATLIRVGTALLGERLR